jgi:arabinose-5-phosphate isomerase
VEGHAALAEGTVGAKIRRGAGTEPETIPPRIAGGVIVGIPGIDAGNACGALPDPFRGAHGKQQMHDGTPLVDRSESCKLVYAVFKTMKPENDTKNGRYRTRAQEVLRIERGALDAVMDQIDDGFAAAVDLILASLRQRGKVVVTGVGKSLLVGQKISATLASTGTTSVMLHPTDAAHGDLGIVCDGDVVIALSYSGESEELMQLLPNVKRFDVSIVALTANADSTLGRFSDAVIRTHVPQEACPFNLVPTSSTTVMMAVGDALAMVLLEARGFREEDYARLHPGGAIGRTMLVRVGDIMRTGDRNPVVGVDRTVADALMVITRCRSGLASVVDDSGILAGVFTDGDLRRSVQRDRATLDRPLREVMTRDPVTLRRDALAVEALKVFQENSIDDLVVVDDEGRPVGIVDLQDLPKCKIL